jgi:acyl dehydratase
VSTAVESEFYVGRCETFRKVITEGEAVMYAGLIGDVNAHHVETSAEETSTPRLQVNPLFMAGIIGGLLNTRLPGAGAQCLNIQFEFLAPILAGDVIETSVELLELNEEKHLATFRADCYNQNHHQVLTAQAAMLIPH